MKLRLWAPDGFKVEEEYGGWWIITSFKDPRWGLFQAVRNSLPDIEKISSLPLEVDE